MTFSTTMDVTQGFSPLSLFFCLLLHNFYVFFKGFVYFMSSFLLFFKSRARKMRGKSEKNKWLKIIKDKEEAKIFSKRERCRDPTR